MIMGTVRDGVVAGNNFGIFAFDEHANGETEVIVPSLWNSAPSDLSQGTRRNPPLN